MQIETNLRRHLKSRPAQNSEGKAAVRSEYPSSRILELALVCIFSQFQAKSPCAVFAGQAESRDKMEG